MSWEGFVEEDERPVAYLNSDLRVNVLVTEHPSKGQVAGRAMFSVSKLGLGMPALSGRYDCSVVCTCIDVLPR